MGSPPPSERLQRALAHFQAGAFPQAEALAKAEVQSQPKLDAAHALLARAQRMQGRPLDAAESCEAALKRLPSALMLWLELAMAQRAAGRADDAEATYRHILTMDTQHALAWHNLGNVLQSRAAWQEAVACYARALNIQPSLIASHFELGNAQLELGNTDAALAAWQEAVNMEPRLSVAWFRIGELLLDTQADRALVALENGLKHSPHEPTPLSQRSVLLTQAGRAQEALEGAELALTLAPKLAMAALAKGMALRGMGRHAQAREWLGQAAQAEEDLALKTEATYQQALSHHDQCEFDEAQRLANAVIDMSSSAQQRGTAQQLKGTLLFDMGRVAEAQHHFEQACRLTPDLMQARTSLVASGLYVDEDDGSANKALAQKVLSHASLNTQASAQTQQRSPAHKGRLRIGWLSGDFRHHSCAFFLEPLLEHLDRSRFELFAYDTGTSVDAVTQRMRQWVPNWRSVASLGSGDLAQVIAGDQLHMLIDLAGLTKGERLPAIAARPAPVQVSWLGYLGTCGHEAIEHRISDRWVESARTQHGFVEQAVVMDRPYLCYRPASDAPEVASLPMLSHGAPTFGSFNTLSKLSDRTVALWSRILKAVPNARLLLKTRALSDPGARAYTLARFAEQGVAGERIELVGWSPQVQHHLSLYQHLDVALDTFPFNGVTTTCESLWMGVPVVSRVGESVCSRQGLSLLNAVGLPEMACLDDDAVVARCVSLVAQPEALAALRADLRAQMARSALCDEAGMARAFEHVLEGLVRPG
jgi:protein O-GlcNAc transferase